MSDKAKRAHKGTYAHDKRKGGYNVRVVGPHAGEFAEREIPVTTRDGQEHMEKLVKLLWLGTDKDTGQPAALYSFEARPKEKLDEIPF